MGWSFTHREKGLSAKEFFRQEFGDGVIDAASPSFRETYVAYQAKDQNGEVKGVFCVVCFTSWRREDYLNFGYKDVDESQGPGPGAYNCP